MSNEINDNELSRDPMEEEGGDGGDGGTKVIPVEIRKEMKKSFID